MPKMMRGLTQKMKNFCYAYARCCNATEAYLEAYDTTNRSIAGVEANKLLARDDITEFLKELNKPTENQIINEREKKRKIIWDRIEVCLEKGDETAIARYMDILNKMDSEYVNINRNTDESTVKLAGLDIDQLKDILGEPTEK